MILVTFLFGHFFSKHYSNKYMYTEIQIRLTALGCLAEGRVGRRQLREGLCVPCLLRVVHRRRPWAPSVLGGPRRHRRVRTLSPLGTLSLLRTHHVGDEKLPQRCHCRGTKRGTGVPTTSVNSNLFPKARFHNFRLWQVVLIKYDRNFGKITLYTKLNLLRTKEK